MRCAYEFQRFEKVAWSYVKKGAKLVFEVRTLFPSIDRSEFSETNNIFFFLLEAIDNNNSQFQKCSRFLWRGADLMSQVSRDNTVQFYSPCFDYFR